MFLITLFSPAAYAEGASWSFQYVSRLMEETPPPRVWFTRDELGLGESIEDDLLSVSGDAHELFLHMETYGAVGMSLSCTPLTDGRWHIPYVFTYEGQEDGSFEIGDESVSIPFLGWVDQKYIVSRRTWRVTWTPDAEALSNALQGVYSTQLKVEVFGE